ncbi:MAG: flavodoxin-dependent (E)-4-hydroxy-3-methylbut-2-enyl-diphosphate synthase [Verrucomicrobiota bacterium]|jgi:(E)-4-hydroxy-3-methylbut-2-enyl-diphosphate synthase|nr:flavodoxin-dependent (E)-4-hydroxy-3-methylbut-2-enyl-diphosphate synthase [Verrucomicrobiota bacterium]
MIPRAETRRIRVGPVAVGGGAPVSVQTMANAHPHDAAGLLRQIEEAAELGCDIVRLTVPDAEAAAVFGDVRKRSPVPLVADIHFDYRLALAAVEAGADGLRINPGNIGGAERVRAVVAAARGRGVPIRIGVNGGSLEKDILAKHGSATAEALVESALRHVALLEAEDYREIKISVKASDVPRTLAAYRLLSSRTAYPLHLGVTEAGTFLPGTVRSCVALGALLLEGIGDTVRVSLTDTPAREVRVGVELLRSAGLRAPGAAVTSCPTCGRTRVDVAGLAARVEERLECFYRAHPSAPRPHVAVMGCAVNGPGEAREADLALCGGDGKYALYLRGEHIKTLPEAEALETLAALVEAWPPA